MISNAVNKIENEYNDYEKKDKELREDHLVRFRPNLSNPANAEELKSLNIEAKDRTDKFLEKVDDTQMELLDYETQKSNEFHVAYLNNLRCLLSLYNRILYKEHFIKLPGDEIVEKKALNIKILTAKHQGHDISFKPKRKWKGLGKNPFNIDLTKLENFADFKKPEAASEVVETHVKET